MAVDNTGAPSNYGASASNSSTTKKKIVTKKPVAKTTKTVATPGTKVSQKTINNIKSMGMSKTLQALKSIGQPGGKNVPASKEFIEGARRMYGSRVDKYLPSTYGKTGYPSSGGKSGSKPAVKPTAKNNTKSNLIKGTLGAAAAVGVLAASKGKGAAVAAKLSPAVGKLASSTAGKAIFGTGEKLTNKAFSASGRVAAKTKGTVSQSQYEAMIASAKAKGIKPKVTKTTKK